ncbi:T9SS type A sorting domain-containing protein [Flavobacterium sp. SUN046]|uniref:T9SS type A sorting domain-containing protein n=1 Tax=Flavobacterium sp. SUN046 TaxID=3002440 RepID=UPI002DB89322|nr:T9SS type A sorting domain-containing protein [Flavobacterium sp. SUN046]MEC4050574.1 T9SS type A sorting domain-containing protein [Flavobacterium sp. SUN046]
MKPIDGWEIIAYNLGYDNNNTVLSIVPEHTYMMLYNKYTGILRILVKWCRNTNYNGALLTLKFSPGFQTNLLDMSNEEKALDIPHISNPSMSTALKFYNDNNFWAYADFKLNYDPCTCAFSEVSRLFLYSELISNSSVSLTGKISGTITSISNGSGTTSSNGNFWKSASSVNDNMMKVHKGVQDFANDYQTIYKDLADGGVTINAINQIGNFLNNNAFMKAGLKALPYVSQGVKFLTGLLGGGESGTQPLQLAPLSVNLDVKINGTITTADPMHNYTIGLPGSQQQNALLGTSGGQPLYNETLGVFALVNHPIMYFTETITKQSFLNREVSGIFNNEYYELMSRYNFIQRNYKLSGDALKYVINPASKLNLQDAEIILITEYEKPSLTYNKLFTGSSVFSGLDIDTANGLDILGTDKGPIVDNDNSIFQNAFKPIGILNYKNDYSFSYLYNITFDNFSQIRRLDFTTDISQNKIWKCYGCYGTPNIINPDPCGTNSCQWSSGSNSRYISYEQNKTSIPISWSGLKSSDFKQNFNLLVSPNFIKPKAEFLAPRIKGFKLKFILNLKRTDNPTAQNVLYVVTYPIELKPAPVGYNMSGSNYISDASNYATQPSYIPSVITNKVIPATQAELSTLCSSLTYRNNRNSTTGKLNENILNNEKENESLILYPVPTSDKLNVVLNNCEIISVIDFYGKTVMDFSTIQMESSNGEVSIETSSFAKGIYLLKYKNKNGEVKIEKFLID